MCDSSHDRTLAAPPERCTHRGRDFDNYMPGQREDLHGIDVLASFDPKRKLLSCELVQQ